jgi:fatty acid-binding protein DegV
MLIVTLYTKMSEYTQNNIVTNNPMSLSFHILHSHFAKSGQAALAAQI